MTRSKKKKKTIAYYKIIHGSSSGWSREAKTLAAYIVKQKLLHTSTQNKNFNRGLFELDFI